MTDRMTEVLTPTVLSLLQDVSSTWKS